MHPVLLGLAANPALPPALVDRLISTADPDIANELSKRDDLTPTQARALIAVDETCAWHLAERHTLDIDASAHPDAALALLHHGRGRPEWARTLAASPARRVQLAECPNLPPDVQETLANDENPEVVAEFAIWAPAPIAARLARHPHAEVRCGVAANTATPPNVLAALLTGAGPPASLCIVCEREQIPFVHDPYCPRTDCDLPAGAACDGTHQSTVHTMHLRALENPSTPTSAAMPFANAGRCCSAAPSPPAPT